MKPDYSFYIFLVYVSFFSTLFASIVGGIKIKELSRESKALFYFTIVSVTSELIIFILRELNTKNWYVARIYNVLEFSLISLFYIRIFKNSIIEPGLKILIPIFLGVAILDLYINGFNSLDNISLTTECILLMIYSILAFFHLIQNPVYENILSAPLFWFNTGILLYFAGNLFLFVFSNYIENHFAKVSPALWGIHSALNIIFYLLISIGFWRTEAKRI